MAEISLKFEIRGRFFTILIRFDAANIISLAQRLMHTKHDIKSDNSESIKALLRKQIFE